MNCEMVTFGEYGKGFAAVLWMQWAEFVAIFKAKGGAVVTKMWAVSWDKCSEKVGVKETHTHSAWLLGKLRDPDQWDAGLQKNSDAGPQ